MTDPTENIRRVMVAEINAEQAERERLEEKHGKVYDTDEITEAFILEGFFAPFVFGREKATGRKCTLMFQHNPRFYWFDGYTD